MNRDTRARVYHFLKVQGTILFYFLQILFVLIYSEPEVQPFVYINF